MTTPHPNKDVLIALAEGKAVQHRCGANATWEDYVVPTPSMLLDVEWRVKPVPAPDVVLFSFVDGLDRKRARAFIGNATADMAWGEGKCNLKLTFCGETVKLKHVEVV